MNSKMLLGLTLLGMGCATLGQSPESRSKAFFAKLQHQASVDLGCPETQLHVIIEITFSERDGSPEPTGGYHAYGCHLFARYEGREEGTLVRTDGPMASP